MNFTVLLDFSFPSAISTNLGLGSALTKAALQNLGKEGSASSLEMFILTQHYPLGLLFTFLKDSGCLAQEVGKICPSANSPSKLELHIAQPQQLVP